MNGSAIRCATARGMSMRGFNALLIASAVSALAIIAATPVQAEQIGLNCTLTQSHYAADGTRVRSSGASTNINIDTTRRVWWSTSTRQHDQNMARSAWNLFEGDITPIASLGSEYIELVRLNDYGLFIGVNRRTGRLYGRQVTSSGNTGEWSGTCVRGSFGPPPERRF